MLPLSRLLLICFLFITLASASSSSHTTAVVPAQAGEAVSVVAKKQNFLDRLLHLFDKKKAVDVEKGDRQAGMALGLGIGAIGALLLGLFVPFVMLATIPLGIVAITNGRSALKNNTKRDGAARTGVGLGIGALGAFVLLVILVVAIVAAWAGSW